MTGGPADGGHLFRNVQVWDGAADDRFPGEVLVVGNRIAKVARGDGQIAAEQAAEMIDGAGLTLMPGLVEGHCHLSFCGPMRNQDLGEIPPEEHLLRTCRNATFILNHGFTSCYSAASAKLRIDVVVRQEIEDGYLAGPRYRAAGPEITVTGGLGDERKQHMHAESFGMIADGPTKSARAVRLCCREGVDNVKINISGDEFVSNARAEITSMSEDRGRRRASRPRMNGTSASPAMPAPPTSVKRAVRNGVDCIYHCDFADEEALDMLEAVKDRVFVGPAFGLVHNCGLRGRSRRHDPRRRREAWACRASSKRRAATYEEMRKRGMRVVIGGDYGFTDHADGPERPRHRPFRQVLRLIAGRGACAARPRSAAT